MVAVYFCFLYHTTANIYYCLVIRLCCVDHKQSRLSYARSTTTWTDSECSESESDMDGWFGCHHTKRPEMLVKRETMHCI